MRAAPHPCLPTPGRQPQGQAGLREGNRGEGGPPTPLLPVPRVDPAGGAVRVVYVVDLAVEVTRLLPALRQGQLRPGHLSVRRPRSPMQFAAAAGLSGSGQLPLVQGAAQAPCSEGWRPRIWLSSGGRPGWRRRPCGPAAPARRRPLLPPPASHAAMCARSGAVRARVRAQPAGRSGPSAAAARPPPPPPPPPRCALLLLRAARGALHPASPPLPSPAGRRPSGAPSSSRLLRLATCASARCGSSCAGNCAAPETGGGAPGARVPGSPPRAQRREGGS